MPLFSLKKLDMISQNSKALAEHLGIEISVGIRDRLIFHVPVLCYTYYNIHIILIFYTKNAGRPALIVLCTSSQAYKAL